jgi:pimeloyl-ACP methyl ester carboxylesterase
MAISTTKANGLELAYEQIGNPSNPPVLLIMGLGSQMISWHDGFCEQLADRGFHVTRYNNRDVGLSTHFTEAGIPDIGALMRGEELEPPYLVEDMAADAASLLEALSLSPAHVVGVSMGGMIAQSLAINHPGSAEYDLHHVHSVALHRCADRRGSRRPHGPTSHEQGRVHRADVFAHSR